MKQFAKLTSIVAAGVLCATVASAAPQFKIINYDATDMFVKNGKTYVGIVYEQYDDNGKSTQLVVEGAEAKEVYGLDGYAEVEFNDLGYEAAWPNRVYASMFDKTNNVEVLNKIFYTGEQEQLEYRWANFYWELAQPHRIFKIKQAKTNNYTRDPDGWYSDETYPLDYTKDVATVKAEYNNYYGFGFWKVVDGKIVNQMWPALRPYAGLVNESVVATKYGSDKSDEFTLALKPLANEIPKGAKNGTVNGYLDLTGYVDIKVKNNFSLVVCGPKYNFDGSVDAGNEFALVCSAAEMEEKSDAEKTLKNFAVEDLVKPIDSYDYLLNKDKKPYEVTNSTYADIEWVYGGYEKEYPFRYFEIMKINGILMDGHSIGVWKIPYIYRYTGAYAQDITEYYKLNELKANLTSFVIALAK